MLFNGARNGYDMARGVTALGVGSVRMSAKLGLLVADKTTHFALGRKHISDRLETNKQSIERDAVIKDIARSGDTVVTLLGALRLVQLESQSEAAERARQIIVGAAEVIMDAEVRAIAVDDLADIVVQQDAPLRPEEHAAPDYAPLDFTFVGAEVPQHNADLTPMGQQ